MGSVALVQVNRGSTLRTILSNFLPATWRTERHSLIIPTNQFSVLKEVGKKLTKGVTLHTLPEEVQQEYCAHQSKHMYAELLEK